MYSSFAGYWLYLSLQLIIGMFKCQSCQHETSSLKSYTNHYVLHRQDNVRFPCGVQRCHRTFSTYSAFKSHVSRDHLDPIPRPGNNERRCEGTNLYSCIFCQEQFADLTDIFRHLKTHIRDGNEIECPFRNCQSRYRVVSSFSSHLARFHEGNSFEMILKPDIVGVPSEEAQDHVAEVDEASEKLNCNGQTRDGQLAPNGAAEAQGGEATDVIVDNDTASDGEGNSNDDTEDAFLHCVAKFYLRLESKFHLPQTVIQEIITGVCDFHKLGQEHLKSLLKGKLHDSGVAEDIYSQVVDIVFESDLLNLAHNGEGGGHLATTYKRKQYYKENLGLISPHSILLGKDDSNTNRMLHYVPIKESQALFRDPSVQEQYLAKKQSIPDVFEDFTDGEVFKSHELFGVDHEALPLILYQDAFEVVNLLGSAKSKHKILAVYFTLGSLHPHNRSKVDPMQLVLLCKEKDFKYFKAEKVFHQLVEDVKEIEEKGLDIICRNNIKHVKGSIIFIAGDNLGSHTIGGFLESFSTPNHWCRFCLITGCN